jgi:Haem-binding domain
VRTLLTIAVIGVGAFGVLQVAPVEKVGIHREVIGTNPPERFVIDAPPDVLAILHRACWDCHTNETKWPLYARIAPSSWLLAHDVHDGRAGLNFSTWGHADTDERQADRKDSWDQVESGAMPPWSYVHPFHPRAKLSDADKAALKTWFLSGAPHEPRTHGPRIRGKDKEAPL